MVQKARRKTARLFGKSMLLLTQIALFLGFAVHTKQGSLIEIFSTPIASADAPAGGGADGVPYDSGGAGSSGSAGGGTACGCCAGNNSSDSDGNSSSGANGEGAAAGDSGGGNGGGGGGGK
ncbi:MAG: hypothetical protein WCK46_01135 [Candidatus Adlerbacteria bacterium]